MYYNKQITTRDNNNVRFYDNVRSYDQEVSKVNSTIIQKTGTYTLRDGKMIKNPLNKKFAVTVKNN